MFQPSGRQRAGCKERRAPGGGGPVPWERAARGRRRVRLAGETRRGAMCGRSLSYPEVGAWLELVCLLEPVGSLTQLGQSGIRLCGAQGLLDARAVRAQWTPLSLCLRGGGAQQARWRICRKTPPRCALMTVRETHMPNQTLPGSRSWAAITIGLFRRGRMMYRRGGAPRYGSRTTPRQGRCCETLEPRETSAR
jgi:hypothetical protein